MGIDAILARYETSAQGTFGIMTTTRGFGCHVVELPWHDNRANISCIPPGTYNVRLRRSRKFGLTYHIQDVEGRSWILAHTGNLAGDRSAGYKTHSAGCLLLGKYRGTLNIGGRRQRAVLVSRPTVRAFMASMGHKPFRIMITGG